MLEEVLANGQMDSLEKIERLDAILSVAANDKGSSESIRSSPIKCSCSCGYYKNQNESKIKFKESYSQTLSTGDIVITRIFSTEEEEEREKLLCASKKPMI